MAIPGLKRPGLPNVAASDGGGNKETGSGASPEMQGLQPQGFGEAAGLERCPPQMVALWAKVWQVVAQPLGKVRSHLGSVP